MYNPLSILTTQLMQALFKEPKLFVRQYYERGRTGNETPLLLTFYYKENKKQVLQASRHMELLKHDRFRFLYDSENEEHRERLLMAASQPTGFRIYVNLLPQRWQIDNKLQQQLFNYMKQHFTSWPPNGPPRLDVQLQDHYGQLYLLVSWQGHKTQILLDHVEKMDAHVL